MAKGTTRKGWQVNVKTSEGEKWIVAQRQTFNEAHYIAKKYHLTPELIYVRIYINGHAVYEYSLEKGEWFMSSKLAQFREQHPVGEFSEFEKLPWLDGVIKNTFVAGSIPFVINRIWEYVGTYGPTYGYEIECVTDSSAYKGASQFTSIAPKYVMSGAANSMGRKQQKEEILDAEYVPNRQVLILVKDGNGFDFREAIHPVSKQPYTIPRPS